MSEDFYNIATDCVDKHVGSGKTALHFVSQKGVQRFTFDEIKKFTDSAAWYFQSQNLKRGDRVVITLPNSPDFIFAFIGAVKVGLVPVPVSSMLTESELDFIVKDSGAKLALKFPPPLVGGGQGEGIQVPPTHPNDPAYWLYTSGTEGTPKGVIHAHQSIPAHDERVKLWLDFREGDVVFNTSSLNWSYALTCGWLDIWRQGGEVVIYSGPMTAEAIWGVIRDLKVTIFMSVPGVYRRLKEIKRTFEKSPPTPLFQRGEILASQIVKPPFEKFNPPLEKGGWGDFSDISLPPTGVKGGFSLRVCLSAGEKLDEEIRQKFLKKTGLTIREGLGMTEHSVYLVQRADEAPVQGSCGKPLPGTRIAILKSSPLKNGPGFHLPPLKKGGRGDFRNVSFPLKGSEGGFQEADIGEVGVIATHRSCPGLMLGYHTPPFPWPPTQNFPSPLVGEGQGEGDPVWFISNDLAFKDKDGNFFFLGRKDDVITAGGYRISPMEVEAAINRYPDVLESAVVGKELEPGKTIIVAYVVCRGGVAQPLPKDLMAHALQHLAKYKIPREIIFVDQLPKTGNGKIKRKKLF